MKKQINKQTKNNDIVSISIHILFCIYCLRLLSPSFRVFCLSYILLFHFTVIPTLFSYLFFRFYIHTFFFVCTTHIYSYSCIYSFVILSTLIPFSYLLLVCCIYTFVFIYAPILFLYLLLLRFVFITPFFLPTLFRITPISFYYSYFYFRIYSSSSFTSNSSLTFHTYLVFFFFRIHSELRFRISCLPASAALLDITPRRPHQ